MYPPFNQKIAHSHCISLIQSIENGQTYIRHIAKPSLERLNQGIMIGSLVCKNQEGEDVILYALSGNAKELDLSENLLKQKCIVVPSIVAATQIEIALEKNDKLIHQLTEKINNGQKELISERTKLTDESLRNVFSLYEFTRFDGTKITLNSIINSHNNKLPPTGTGDCCAPKLLSYAFSHNLIPYSMDEIYYGPNTKSKENLHSYPPCDERCGYILPEILGLNILYKDNDIVVVNKQSGLLSVPGRTEDKKDCIVSRVSKLYKFDMKISQPSVHRLDMETSGLMVIALNKESHRNLSIQFEKGLVEKEYEALLDGVLEKSTGDSSPLHGEKSGEIQLKFRLDIDNRPHQIYDEVNGKLGITLWKKENTELYYYKNIEEKRPVTRITYKPITGRTHQLRLVSSDVHGFNLPIIGDTLYGKCLEGERLMLHAKKLEFNHPVTNEKMVFISKPDF